MKCWTCCMILSPECCRSLSARHSYPVPASSSSSATSLPLRRGCFPTLPERNGARRCSARAAISTAPPHPRCSMFPWRNTARTPTCARKARSRNWPWATAALSAHSRRWELWRWDLRKMNFSRWWICGVLPIRRSCSTDGAWTMP